MFAPRIFTLLISLSLVCLGCQGDSGGKDKTYTEIEDTGEASEQPESELAENCQFSLQSIQKSPDKQYTAVVGTKACENGEFPTYTEVTIYKQGEAINGKPSNVFKASKDVIMEIRWDGKALHVMHNADQDDVVLKQSVAMEDIQVTYGPLD